MKSRKFTSFIAVTLFAALALPVQLAAQQHTLYRLIDIGTFGGPASYLGDPGVGPGVLHLNNRGVLIGHADTRLFPIPRTTVATQTASLVTLFAGKMASSPISAHFRAATAAKPSRSMHAAGSLEAPKLENSIR